MSNSSLPCPPLGPSLAAGSVAAALLLSAWRRQRLAVEIRGSQPITRADRALLRKKYSKKHVDGSFDVVVIGSGMGSLSCAAILARCGRKVLVLEQHPDVAGGGTHQFDLGGYRFDSGLHYTVPWSVPVFALTCLLKPADVTPFDIMGEDDGTIDNIFLQESNGGVNNASFRMILHEKHLHRLYEMFPQDRAAIDAFMVASNRAMLFIKIYIASRLLPQWLQRIYWRLVPSSIINVAEVTAETLLPSLTTNKRLISLLSSMWIDTGARPDQASFAMTAAVFRGITMEGGCYPSRGAEEMAIELARVIVSNGGSILINAHVDEIIIDEAKCVRGVKMADGTKIAAGRVVSGAGYATTFRSLVNSSVVSQLKIPTSLTVPQSAGFVMVNIGIRASAADINAYTSNTWHIPVDSQCDSFEPMRRYFANPLGVGADMPAFITFPSCKDKKWETDHPGRVSCQMLFMANYDWFSQFSGDGRKAGGKGAMSSATAEAYAKMKEDWKAKALVVFYKYFPKAKDLVDFVDISTPLSAEDYLNAYRGSAVGIDVTPARFVDANVREHLDAVVPEIHGLYMTGQDTLLCGVTLAQLAGVITAFRMEGFWTSVGMVAKAILFT